MCNFPLNIAKGWTKNLSKKSFDISKQERVCSLKDRSVEVLLLINCWKFYFGLTLEQFRISGGQITFFDFLQKMWTVVLSMLGVKIKQEQVCSLKDRIGWFYFWLIRIFLFRIFCSGISLNILTGFVFLSKKSFLAISRPIFRFRWNKRNLRNSNLDHLGHFLFHKFLSKMISLKDDLIEYMCACVGIKVIRKFAYLKAW